MPFQSSPRKRVWYLGPVYPAESVPEPPGAVGLVGGSEIVGGLGIAGPIGMPGPVGMG